MYSKSLFFLLLFSITVFAQNQFPIIPKPQSITTSEDNCTINAETVLLDASNSFEATFLKETILSQTGLDLKIQKKVAKASSVIELQILTTSTHKSDYYEIAITPNKVLLSSASPQGLFYAVQSLVQLLPIEKARVIHLPCMQIKDQSKFSWRGMHLDVCRHFFPKEFIKKYIDYLAMYKLNTFHWHLTDDQGWRIEIKKYPKLTQVGAWRNGSMIGHYTDQTFDSIRYGGYYTQNDIREIVAYAQQRHITIVPEIEMPGHAVAALASYPEFSCTGASLEVAKTWGVLEDVFCPKEETFQFLEGVLEEVVDLFPSPYIHIGGDESPKTRWKVCSNCQKRIRDLGLKDEHELQSYFIQRIEKFLQKKGRKIIGWDEILEGGLAPNAAVMSWRGTEGGIAAAKQKHEVVMSPGSHCYFDHYQGEPKNEPIAFGGYTTVEKVYHFDPIPKTLSSEEAKYILGAQANLWTEYIPTTSHAEYMLFPRLAALSEVVWGTSSPNNYKEFEKRLITHFKIYDKKGINYSKAIFEVTSKVQPAKNGVLFELKSVNPNGIKYTTDGSEPKAKSMSYEKPVLVGKNQTIKAAYFENGKAISATIEQPFFITKSTGKNIELLHQPHENYGIGGSFTLVDGMIGNPSKFGRDWLGFWGKDIEATIDLGASLSIQKMGMNVLKSEGSWIYYPQEIQFLVSEDGIHFQKIATVNSEAIEKEKGKVMVQFPLTKATQVKIVAKNYGIIPDGKQGAGSYSWLFADEISVE